MEIQYLTQNFQYQHGINLAYFYVNQLNNKEQKKVVTSQIEELKNLLAYGSASSYADYRQIVGRIEGIELSKDNLVNIVKTRIYSEED